MGWLGRLRDAYRSLDPVAIERGRWVMFIAGCLIVAGLVWVESASYPRASAPDGTIDAFSVFKRQAQFAAAGLLVMFAFALMPTRRWLAGVSYVGLIVSIVWMVAAAVYGAPRHGTRAWLFLQPSEFAKVFLMVLAAGLFARRQPVRSLLQSNVVAFLLVVALVGGILVAQRDIGMLLLVAIAALAVLFVGGVSVVELMALAASGTAAVAALLVHDPVRLKRIGAWLWPKLYLDGPGYHVISMLIAIGRGRGLGLLPAGSPDKWYALPYPATDSIFCVIAAESGLWGTALLLGAFGALLVLALIAAHHATSEFDRVAALGCGLLLSIQAAIHIGVAVNLLPATGLTLPFISAGGSSLLASSIAAGIIANVARRGLGATQDPAVA